MIILQGTFDFSTIERAEAVAAAMPDDLAKIKRTGSRLVVQGSHAAMMAWLKGLKASHAIGGLLHAGLQAQLTQAKPVPAIAAN